MSKIKLNIITILLCSNLYAQSDIEKAVRVGEVILNGFSILKSSKSNTKENSKFISSVCIKNKLLEKITFKISGKDEDGEEIKKEMVIQTDGKECVFNISKGIYSYEVNLANNDVYKKGEYKFDNDVVITIKKEE